MTHEVPADLPYLVRFAPEFKRALRHLSKKYRSLRHDIQPVIDDLMAGGLPGDHISEVDFPVYKVRVRNTDAQRGKRGGYRLIYACLTDTTRVLITLYAKTEQQDISPTAIQTIIQEDSDHLLLSPPPPEADEASGNKNSTIQPSSNNPV